MFFLPAKVLVKRVSKSVSFSDDSRLKRKSRQLHHLYSQIDIAAPIGRVWTLLTDFSSYARWNPHVRSVEGKLVVGASLKVFTQPPGGKGLHFRPTLLAAQPNRELRWKGSFVLGVPRLFDGEHYFKLEERHDGVVILHHGEFFSGVLVPLFKRSLNGEVSQGFIATNEALKREAERQ
jgi:hypothetical protein